MEIVEKSQPCYSATDALAAVKYLVVYQQIFLRLLSYGLNFQFQLRHVLPWHTELKSDRDPEYEFIVSFDIQMWNH